MTKRELKDIINECLNERYIEEGGNLFLKSGIKGTKTTPGLKAQLLAQKKVCKNKYNACKNENDYKNFANWLNQQIKATQRKINGKEIKNKDLLQKFIDLYNSYLDKCNNATINEDTQIELL